MSRLRIHLTVYLLTVCSTVYLAAQSTPVADGVVPGVVKFAGVLNAVSGKPLTGTIGVTFVLYKEQSGGTPLWMETQNVQPDRNGHYSIMLGSATNHGMPADAFAAGEARWIGVQVSGQSELARVQLVSVPYALKAADAQTLGGLPPSAFLLAAPQTNASVSSTATSSPQSTSPTAVTTGGGTAQSLAKFDGAADIASSEIFDTGTSVGIGTSAPQGKLDVKGSAFVRGVLTLPATGNSTAAAGKSSQPQSFVASSFSSSISTPVNQVFRWQAEPANNNTTTPSATLNLLYGLGATTPTETGLRIGPQGMIAFAPGQNFPGAGTVKSVGLSAPASDFNVSNSPVTASGNLNLQWLTPPTSSNVANAIVKRDATGNIVANVISGAQMNATQFRAGNLLAGNLFSSPIVGENHSTGAVQANGVVGITHSTTNAGVFGRSEDGGIGVMGQTLFDSGQGVWGESFGVGVSVNGFAPDGVVGISHSNVGNGVEAKNNSGGTALLASANTGSAVLALSTSGTAVFASTNSGSAGEFFGNVDVEGTLSKSAGSFKIDHPLDPANKYLYHSFVESPDMMNIYNGNVTTDAQGDAVVVLPDWFEALNRDFRYQLTVIGQFAQAIVASKMAEHHFTIRTDKPNVEVSWQVTGVRHDAFAEAHRIPVEEAKSDKEVGHYLHPELFGAPAEKSIAAARHPGVQNVVNKLTTKPASAFKQ